MPEIDPDLAVATRPDVIIATGRRCVLFLCVGLRQISRGVSSSSFGTRRAFLNPMPEIDPRLAVATYS